MVFLTMLIKVKADKEVVLAVIKNNPLDLEYADKKYNPIKKSSLQQLKKWALEYADKKLQADKEVVPRQ